MKALTKTERSELLKMVDMINKYVIAKEVKPCVINETFHFEKEQTLVFIDAIFSDRKAWGSTFLGYVIVEAKVLGVMPHFIQFEVMQVRPFSTFDESDKIPKIGEQLRKKRLSIAKHYAVVLQNFTF